MRRVAYLPGGNTSSGLPLIVVPIDTPPSGLCSGSSSVPSSSSSSSPQVSSAANKELNESFDSCAARLGRTEEEHCRDLDRVLRYLLPIAT